MALNQGFIRFKNFWTAWRRLIRFWDEEVYNDLDNVLRVIEIAVLEQIEGLGI